MTADPASATLYGLCGAALVGVGLWGVVARRHLLRRLVAFNITGAGIFLVFCALAYRRPLLGGDPVPHAMILTGIVISLAATAVGVALIARQAEATRRARLPEDASRQDLPNRDGEA